MLLHSARSTHAARPVIDSDRDDWWRLARCAAPDRDMWTADDVHLRVAAAHQCIAHCPVVADCHRDSRDRPWRSVTAGGVVYGLDGRAVNLEPPAVCRECAPNWATKEERRRLQWRESQARRREASS
jgi:hypothetical protein